MVGSRPLNDAVTQSLPTVRRSRCPNCPCRGSTYRGSGVGGFDPAIGRAPPSRRRGSPLHPLGSSHIGASRCRLTAIYSVNAVSVVRERRSATGGWETRAKAADGIRGFGGSISTVTCPDAQSRSARTMSASSSPRRVRRSEPLSRCNSPSPTCRSIAAARPGPRRPTMSNSSSR